MKKSRFREEQIIGLLKQGEAVVKMQSKYTMLEGVPALAGDSEFRAEWKVHTAWWGPELRDLYGARQSGNVMVVDQWPPPNKPQ